MTVRAIAAPVAGADKLPVFATVGRAWRAAFANARTVFAITWFWSLVLLVMHWASWRLLPVWMTTPAAIMQLEPHALLLVSFAGLLNGLAILPLFASIAVNWHRLLLLGERPAPGAFIRLDGLVWSYAALAALIALLRFIFSLPHVMMSVHRGAGSMDVNLFRAGAALLSLALPGRAIGDLRAHLMSGCAASHGNTWRLFCGASLAFLPALALAALTFGVWPGYEVMLSDKPLAFYIRVAESMAWPLIGIVFVGYLSYAYEHFFPERVRALRAR